MGNSEYRDSIRLLVGGAEKVARAVGIRKAPLPYDDIFSVSLSERCAAAANHALIILTALEEFSARFEVRIDQLPLTAGAAAIKDVEKFLGHPWPGLEGPSADMARMARYGGRTEIFRRGSFKNVNLYDISSSYPAALLEPVPVGDPDYIRSLSRADAASATVSVPPDELLPALPFRHGAGLYFPTGRFYGSWTGDELRYAKAQGVKVERVEAAVRWRERIDLSGWVQEHYRKRKEDEFSGLYTKILLNS
jgi:hypothetical protein